MMLAGDFCNHSPPSQGQCGIGALLATTGGLPPQRSAEGWGRGWVCSTYCPVGTGRVASHEAMPGHCEMAGRRMMRDGACRRYAAAVAMAEWRMFVEAVWRRTYGTQPSPTMRKPAIAQHLSMLLHGWLPYLSLWDNLCCSWWVFVGAGSFCESASRLPMPARCIVRARCPNNANPM